MEITNDYYGSLIEKEISTRLEQVKNNSQCKDILDKPLVNDPLKQSPIEFHLSKYHTMRNSSLCDLLDTGASPNGYGANKNHFLLSALMNYKKSQSPIDRLSLYFLLSHGADPAMACKENGPLSIFSWMEQNCASKKKIYQRATKKISRQ